MTLIGVDATVWSQVMTGRGEDVRARRVAVGEAMALSAEHGLEVEAGKLLVEIALEVS